MRKSLRKFVEGFGSEAVAKVVSIEGRVLEVKFSGHMCYSCGITDYFVNYTQVLEEVSGVSYALWDYDSFLSSEPYFLVRIVKLDFLDEIKEAMKVVGDQVKQRMAEFEKIGKDEETLFRELCFCILTANYKAEGGIRIQKVVGDGFCSLEANELAMRLRGLGHRFPETRARYIDESRRFHGKLTGILQGFRNEMEAREWLVENVKGLGYKEASHFLRNIGYNDVAIIDRHILRFLEGKQLIKEILKTLNKTTYMEIEILLSVIADRLDLTLGELDLYLWYIKTGKVLK